jgi:hypothetical protein
MEGLVGAQGKVVGEGVGSDRGLGSREARLKLISAFIHVSLLISYSQVVVEGRRVNSPIYKVCPLLAVAASW